MKAINKKIIAGIAGSLVLGGLLVGAMQSEVFANTAAPSASAKPNGDGAMKGGRFGKGHGDMEGIRGGQHVDIAGVLGIDQQVLMQELKSGKTLAQVAQEKAGLSKEALIQKLVDAETKKIDEAVTAGKLTADQAAKIKTDLTARITQSVDATKPAGGMGDGGRGGKGHGPGGHGGPGGPGGPGGHGGGPMGGGHGQELSEITGLTQQELRDGLAAGKSPAELAQEKGVSRDALVGKLKEKAEARINEFVDSKRPAPAPKN